MEIAHDIPTRTLRRVAGAFTAGAVAGVLGSLALDYFRHNDPEPTEEEVAYLQLFLMREAARDVGLKLDLNAETDVDAFRDKTRDAIISKMEIGGDALRDLICIKFDYCQKSKSGWKGLFEFLVLPSLVALADTTGLTLASIWFLASIGYFEKLCDCENSPSPI